MPFLWAVFVAEWFLGISVRFILLPLSFLVLVFALTTGTCIVYEGSICFRTNSRLFTDDFTCNELNLAALV